MGVCFDVVHPCPWTTLLLVGVSFPGSAGLPQRTVRVSLFFLPLTRPFLSFYKHRVLVNSRKPVIFPAVKPKAKLPAVGFEKKKKKKKKKGIGGT